MSIFDESFVLSNGNKIPKIGFGTWQISEGKEVEDAVFNALKNGYRHIDSAYVYENEKGTGKAIKKSGIKRENLFITTKVPAEIKTYKETMEHFNKSLNDLGLDYVDLYLIHAPRPWGEINSGIQINHDEENIEVWKALEDIYKSGRAKAIGVSNFEVSDLQNIINNCEIKPMVNQIRFFIGNTQDNLTKFCIDNNIQVVGYSTLSTGAIFENQEIDNMAKKYNVSVAQICVRYSLQRNVVPLIRSTKEERIVQNSKVDFVIDDIDMNYLNSLRDTVNVSYKLKKD